MVAVMLNGASPPGPSGPSHAPPMLMSSPAPVIAESEDRNRLTRCQFPALPAPTFFTVPVTVICGDESVSELTVVGPETAVTTRSGPELSNETTPSFVPAKMVVASGSRKTTALAFVAALPSFHAYQRRPEPSLRKMPPAAVPTRRLDDACG